MADAEDPREAPSGPSGDASSAVADAPRLLDALESLRLDVEAVFDRHRGLWPKAPGPPERPRPPVLGPADRGQDLPSHPVGLQLPPRTSERRVFPVVPTEQRLSVASRISLETVDSMPPSLRGLRRERESIHTEGSVRNWMRGLVEETQARSQPLTEIHRRMSVMSAKLNQNFRPARSGSADFIPRLVKRTEFDIARIILMILDVVLVAWDMQDAANRATSSLHSSAGIDDTVLFTVLQDLSCVLFVLDLCFRFAAGQLNPINSDGRGWQRFQVVVVVAQLLQAIGQHSHRHQRSSSRFRTSLAMLSTLRLARVLSLVLVTDVIRRHRFFRELRIMVLSLTGAVKAMVWSSLLVLMILLIFGTVLSEGALAFVAQNGPPAADAPDGSAALLARFGSLFDAVLTLFQVITGGVDWEVVWKNLDPLGWGFQGLLLLYIGFSLIALLNVLTAVMIESTLLRCKSDRGLAVQSAIMEKRDYIAAMKKVFRELDDEGNGEISQGQMQRRMQQPEVGAYFSQLGVDSDQVGKLFFLLDSNKNGTVDLEEFMLGCLKLRGDATRLDVAVLYREVQWMHEALEILGKQLSSCSPKGARKTATFVADVAGGRGSILPGAASDWDSEFVR
ncbi:unnamed protein product [Prorocentrum cordatum]|uniref:EF-hand domain-containing protein n=1 Tax=Prorocentrum cordatum TaxID=2364126 RepID=A0ABN9S9F8_9DINO|nr:unnamed protein product [Polarella glacialis]